MVWFSRLQNKFNILTKQIEPETCAVMAFCPPVYVCLVKYISGENSKPCTH